MKTIIEPFRIKSVEPLTMTTVAERELYLKEANYNLFSLKSDNVLGEKVNALNCVSKTPLI